MLRKLFSLLRADRQPSALEMARRSRRHAAGVYAAALERGDTRDAHWALKAYCRATNDVLRLEKVEGVRHAR